MTQLAPPRHLLAILFLAGAAKLALAALGERQHRDPLAESPRRQPIAELDYAAAELVAGDGPRGKQLGDVAEVQVRPADPAVGDLDQRLTDAGPCGGTLDCDQPAILGDLDGPHR